MTHRAILAGVSLGRGVPVAVMGVLNVSPESFHAGSVHTDGDDLLAAALAMVDAGAALIDVGARSTAPYVASSVSDRDECERLGRAVSAEIGTGTLAASTSTARARRSRSSRSPTLDVPYGAVDRAPTSISTAPASAMASAAATRSSLSRWTEPA